MGRTPDDVGDVRAPEPAADTEAGHRNVTHGCVGLATDGTAKRFYNQVSVGDVVTVTGSDKATVGNGYGDWNLTWNQWLEHSAAGQATSVGRQAAPTAFHSACIDRQPITRSP
ncbi:L,D-transpeptidase family protein [Streptomyces sp. NPDC006692]|uniref:L,D-transpeptidase family protein n=1 Tax=Streptomyces sp. NPDC006692 TaxID=3364758 RepID=UPI0036CDE287